MAQRRERGQGPGSTQDTLSPQAGIIGGTGQPSAVGGEAECVQWALTSGPVAQWGRSWATKVKGGKLG